MGALAGATSRQGDPIYKGAKTAKHIKGRGLQERIQILHREGVAPKMEGMFALEVHARPLADPVPR